MWTKKMRKRRLNNSRAKYRNDNVENSQCGIPKQ
jgi:hypothetical protein